MKKLFIVFLLLTGLKCFAVALPPPPTEEDREYVWICRDENWTWILGLILPEMAQIESFEWTGAEDRDMVHFNRWEKNRTRYVPFSSNKRTWSEFNYLYRRTNVSVNDHDFVKQ